MAERTTDQILDQAVYAVQCVSRHYGPEFNAEGLRTVRELLSQLPWFTDSCFRVDCHEDDPFIDFHQRIIWPDGWDKIEFVP
jgi:hypothetical protein